MAPKGVDPYAPEIQRFERLISCKDSKDCVSSNRGIRALTRPPDRGIGKKPKDTGRSHDSFRVVRFGRSRELAKHVRAESRSDRVRESRYHDATATATPIFRYGAIKAVPLTQLDQLFATKKERERYRTLATACALDSGFLVTSVHWHSPRRTACTVLWLHRQLCKFPPFLRLPLFALRLLELVAEKLLISRFHWLRSEGKTHIWIKDSKG